MAGGRAGGEWEWAGVEVERLRESSGSGSRVACTARILYYSLDEDGFTKILWGHQRNALVTNHASTKRKRS
eukprot:scaffold97348_cov30-Tisochrysis_lutea.AAC.1